MSVGKGMLNAATHLSKLDQYTQDLLTQLGERYSKEMTSKWQLLMRAMQLISAEASAQGWAKVLVFPQTGLGNSAK